MSSTILISTSSFGTYSDRPLKLLDEAGMQVRLNPHGRKLNPDETIALLEGVIGIVAGVERLDGAVLEHTPALRVISRCGTGLDSVDLAAAEKLGIRVFNTANAHVDGVAELTLAGMLDVLRSVTYADRAIRAGEWPRPPGRLLRGKVVGLVGFGRVAKRLSELLVPFNVELIAQDVVEDAAFKQRGVQFTGLDELLERADIVSLHLPYGQEVRHLFDGTRLGRMKRGAILVNCARGGIVDEEALVELLASGHLGGAFIDTFEREPYDGPLIGQPTAVLSPHVGSFAAECRVSMEVEAVENLIRFFGVEGR